MLIVKRTKSLVDQEVEYTIEINHIVMGKIGNDEIKQFDLKSGEYEIQIISSDFKSNVIKFSMNDGQIIEMSCVPKFKNHQFSRLCYMIFRRNHGIQLAIKQDIYL